jgi:uncharacterized protein
MKFLLVLAVLGLALWLWRSGRGAARDETRLRPSAKPDAAPKAQEMVPCAWCQVHVPQADAIAGNRGRYCCAQHRQLAEP